MIAAFAPPWTLAAKVATLTIPIVFNTGANPVATGLVASLARPGGNLTGVSILLTELVPKRLELLSEMVPQARVIALLVNPNGPEATYDPRGGERGVRHPERRHGQTGGPPGAVRATAFGTERDSLLISPLGHSIATRARFDLLDSLRIA